MCLPEHWAGHTQQNPHNCIDAALGQHLPPGLTGKGMQLADVSEHMDRAHSGPRSSISHAAGTRVPGGAHLRLTLQILRLHPSLSLISSGPCPENISAAWV